MNENFFPKNVLKKKKIPGINTLLNLNLKIYCLNIKDT